MWRVFGLSWRVTDALEVVLLGITALTLYGLFRLGMNGLLSAGFTVLFMSTPLVMSNFQVERDFNKAPFILGSILIMGRLAKGAGSFRRCVGLAAALGLTIGIGLGFRQDLSLCLVPGAIVLAICPFPTSGHALIARLAAVATMLAAWLVAGFPILSVMRSDEAQTFHSATGGLGCESVLRIPPGTYELVHGCNDVELSMTYSSYGARVKGDRPSYEFYCPEAERRARRFLADAAMAFPADFLNRAYAAILYITNAPWEVTDGASERIGGHVDPILNSHLPMLRKAQTAFAEHWRKYRVGYMLGACLVLGLANFRTACLAVFLLLYFLCSTSIQFEYRHVFHLCFVPLWFVGFLLANVMSALRASSALRGRSARQLVSLILKPAGRAILFTLGLAALLFAPLYASRLYQHGTVASLLTACRDALVENVPVEAMPDDSTDFTVFHPTHWPLLSAPARTVTTHKKEEPTPWPILISLEVAANRVLPHTLTLLAGCVVTFTSTRPPPEITLDVPPYTALRTEYLVAEFEPGALGFSIGPRYAGPSSCLPALWTYTLTGNGGSHPSRVRVFFPVYETSPAGPYDVIRFEGICVAKRHEGEFKGLYRVTDRSRFAFLPTMVLREDSSSFQYYHTLPPIFPEHS